LLTVTFVLLSIGWFTMNTTHFAKNDNVWTNVGGWLGLATAIAAWYASFAAVTNFTYKRTVLPTWPR
jgi:hypothetical protein